MPRLTRAATQKEGNMDIRRVMTDEGALQTEARAGAGQSWQAVDGADVFGYESPFRPEWEAEVATRQGASPGSVVLPFQPLSFRDFMLYEGHYIGVARGYVHRFLPRLAAFAWVTERITRRTFPAFRPGKLWYSQPIYYMSNAQTFVPSGTPVHFPSYSRALDWELELGFVLKAPLLDATPEEAVRAIGAFVVLNDFSARDVQLPEQNSGFGPQKAKHFMSSMSSTAVTPENVLPRWKSLHASVSIDGGIVARPDASQPHWELGEVLAHASASEQLRPGELFGTGTLVGGSGMEIGRWLQPGDTLRLEIEGVGQIEHTINSVAAPHTSR